MDFSLIIAACSMGFLGSFHCAGMCGPILLILPFNEASGWRRVLRIAVYHFGRISTYALMGIVLYAFRFAFHPEVQQYISLGLGLTLLLFGGASLMPTKLHLNIPWLPFAKVAIARVMSRQGLSALLANGMLNGLLPCGLVYVALALAVTAPGIYSALSVMYAFGLGTVPMLVAITLLKSRFSLLGGAFLRKQVPFLLLFFGLLLFVRGMNLGVPYLSPKLAMKAGKVTESCCRHHAAKQ